MRHLAPVALLALLSTFTLAINTKNFQAQDTNHTLFSQRTPTNEPTTRPTTTPTPTRRPQR
jgi:hypothetical protein